MKLPITLAFALLLLAATTLAHEEDTNAQQQEPTTTPITTDEQTAPTEADLKGIRCPYAASEHFDPIRRTLRSHVDNMGRLMNHWRDVFDLRSRPSFFHQPLSVWTADAHPLSAPRTFWNNLAPAFDLERDSLWPAARYPPPPLNSRLLTLFSLVDKKKACGTLLLM